MKFALFNTNGEIRIAIENVTSITGSPFSSTLYVCDENTTTCVKMEEGDTYFLGEEEWFE